MTKERPERQPSKQMLRQMALERLKTAIIASKKTADNITLAEEERLLGEHESADQEAAKLNVPSIAVTRAYLDALSQVSTETAQSFFEQVVKDAYHTKKTLRKLAEDYTLQFRSS